MKTFTRDGNSNNASRNGDVLTTGNVAKGRDQEVKLYLVANVNNGHLRFVDQNTWDGVGFKNGKILVGVMTVVTDGQNQARAAFVPNEGEPDIVYDVFTILVRDEEGAEVEKSVRVKVVGENDAPVLYLEHNGDNDADPNTGNDDDRDLTEAGLLKVTVQCMPQALDNFLTAAKALLTHGGAEVADESAFDPGGAQGAELTALANLAAAARNTLNVLSQSLVDDVVAAMNQLSHAGTNAGNFQARLTSFKKAINALDPRQADNGAFVNEAYNGASGQFRGV